MADLGAGDRRSSLLAETPSPVSSPDTEGLVTAAPLPNARLGTCGEPPPLRSEPSTHATNSERKRVLAMSDGHVIEKRRVLVEQIHAYRPPKM